jgi:hypothetical protein
MTPWQYKNLGKHLKMGRDWNTFMKDVFKLPKPIGGRTTTIRDAHPIYPIREPITPPIHPGAPEWSLALPLFIAAITGIGIAVAIVWFGQASIGSFVLAVIGAIIAGKIVLSILENFGAIIVATLVVGVILYFVNVNSKHTPDRPAIQNTSNAP